jgi:pimeloyl-ACP methyl ester carboxylesterase
MYKQITVLIFTIGLIIRGYGEYHPVIFVHGHMGNINAWDAPNYQSAMERILAEHYQGYTAGVPLNCNENTTLSSTNWDTKRVYNFMYYHPDPDRPRYMDTLIPGAIGSNGILVPVKRNAYEQNLSQGSWAKNLADFIDKVCVATGVNSVDLVCHSMGGLVARAAIKFYNAYEKVHKVITIGTPNHGIKGPYPWAYLSQINVPPWMHTGENLEMEIDKEVKKVEINTTPPFAHITYGPTHDTTFKNIMTEETNGWCSLLNSAKVYHVYSGGTYYERGNEQNYVEYVTISGNRNPFIVPIGNDDGIIDVDWVKISIAKFNPTIFASHCHMSAIPFIRNSAEGEFSLTECTYTTEFIKRWIIDDYTGHVGANWSGDTLTPCIGVGGICPAGCVRLNPGVDDYNKALVVTAQLYDVTGRAVDPEGDGVKAFPIFRYTDANPGRPVFSLTQYPGGQYSTKAWV